MFDIVFTQRCLINLISWKSQKTALNQIHRLLKKDGFLVLLEAFDDGLKELNQARHIIGLEKISPAWHNPGLLEKKSQIKYNNKFVEFFSLMRPLGNYSPLQLTILKKIL